jgi:hypothetical protein
MYQLLIETVKEISFVSSLIYAGAALILVNIISHLVIEVVRERVERKQAIVRYLRPVLKTVADLISRLSDILIVYHEKYQSILISYNPECISDRFKILCPLDMNRHESTAFRLINFLLVAEYFRRKTTDTPTFDLLERAEYYLQHKFPVALRGNLYSHHLLATEVQEELAAAILRLYNKPAADFSIGDFCNLLSSGNYDIKLFNAAMKFFFVNLSLLKNKQEIDRNSDEWRHILTLAHFGVYLIDFFQDLGNNCQWEEQRLFFVKMIKVWNSGSVRSRYLYEPGDLSTSNYLDTYPGRLAPRGMIYGLMESLAELLDLQRLRSRFTKYIKLNRRGLKFRRRHHTKFIHSWGIRIRGSNNIWDLKISDDLQTVYDEVTRYLQTRLV